MIGLLRLMAPAGSGHRPIAMPWLITLADLVSLLLCFFVMLFAMSRVEASRWERVFGVAVRDEVPMSAEPQGDRDAARNAAAAPEARDANYLLALIAERVARAALPIPVTVSRAPEGVVLAMPAAALFPSRPGRRVGAAAERLAPLAALLSSVPNRIAIAVSAPDAREAEAWRRALARGQAAADAMANAGLDRIETVEVRSFGPGKPQVAVLVLDREGAP
ncbi:MAG: flagellar motor protein MotB [Pseudomonadota bacterium]